MPIYEYGCSKCGAEFEVEQRITDDPIKTCQKCRSRKVKRLISRTSFVLKGGGWYSDLYASPSKDGKSGGDQDGKSSGAKDGKSEGSSASESKASESKPTDKGPDKGGKASKGSKPTKAA